MITIELWVLSGAARVIMIALLIRVIIMTVFAILIVFRVMGRDYDAAVMAAGFAGLGLGVTPAATANMDAVTSRYGPSPRAFLVIPLAGASFLDLLNSPTKFFIGVISR